MHQDSLWVTIGYPAIFCTPWALAIVWLVRRTPPGDDAPAPSLGERARRRLDLR